MKTVSFVIPCYRSEHTLPHVTEEIEKTMRMLKKYTYEIILVNDCSPDHTMDTIKKLCRENSNIKGIGFAKNFGQHAALMAGLRFATGDYVICLDDDGQTPADEVGKLLAKMEEGYDAVYAKYEHKQHNAFRNLGSRLNERMTRIMLDKPPELYISSYFGVQRFIVEDMIRYEHSYPYVIGLVLRATKNIANVTVAHREREEGNSGYTMKKLLGLWFNGFTAFSVKPLRFATILGANSAGLGFIYGVYTIIKRFLLPDVPMGYSALMSALVFFGGMIMIMLGLVGEYIGRIYISMNNSPQYVVREKINIKNRSNMGGFYKNVNKRPEGKSGNENDQKRPEGKDVNENGQKRPVGKGSNENSQKRPEGKRANENGQKRPEGKDINENGQKRPEGKGTNENGQKRPERNGTTENGQNRPEGKGANGYRYKRPDIKAASVSGQRLPAEIGAYVNGQRHPEGKEANENGHKHPEGKGAYENGHRHEEGKGAYENGHKHPTGTGVNENAQKSSETRRSI
jgi:undecaprenyl-phosphate 4-deoxy-4-formamido-L-arabinose transferase